MSTKGATKARACAPKARLCAPKARLCAPKARLSAPRTRPRCERVRQKPDHHCTAAVAAVPGIRAPALACLAGPGRRPWALAAGPGQNFKITQIYPKFTQIYPKFTQIYPKFSVFGAAIGPRREISRLNGRIASTSEGLVPRPLSAMNSLKPRTLDVQKIKDSI